MNRLNSMIGIAAMVAGVAFAQKDDGKDKVFFFAGGDTTRLPRESFAITTARFGMMGPAVKGAPYAADGVTETTQTLGDGTHINRRRPTVSTAMAKVACGVRRATRFGSPTPWPT